MRKLSLLLAIPAIMWMSCNRDSILGNPPELQLVKTITKDSSDRITLVAYYNQYGMTCDTGYSSTNGALISIRKRDYNSKGKLTGWQWYLPAFYTAGNHWAAKFSFDNDTILRITEFYNNEKLSTKTCRYYGSTGQPSFDSVFSFGMNPGYSVVHYSYDAQGRALSFVTIKPPNNDTSGFATYQYTANTVEEQIVSFSANNSRTVSKKVTEYRGDGKILSEKQTNEAGQVASEITYTYDAGGRLTDKKTISGSSILEEIYSYDSNGWLIKELHLNQSINTEIIYTNNSAGKPEKMERYLSGKLNSTMYYYYQ